MSEEVLSQFIVECASKGITQPEGIREEAVSRIKAIDLTLAEADKLRPIRSSMVSVIRSFGFDVPKNNRRVIPVLSSDASVEELNSKELSQIIDICKYLENNPSNSATPRDLMTYFGVTPEKDYEIYTLIKWLCSSGICTRTNSGTLMKGANWANRPINIKE